MWSCVKLLSRVQLFAIPWTVAHQAPPSMVFSRQEYRSGETIIPKLYQKRILCSSSSSHVIHVSLFPFHSCLMCLVTWVVSDSVRPHRRQPTRLPRLWDSPGKNTGVGGHFLLQCMKVKSEREVAQSCLTPSDPMDCSPRGCLVHRVFQARVLEWGAIALCSFFSSMIISHLEGMFYHVCCDWAVCISVHLINIHWLLTEDDYSPW